LQPRPEGGREDRETLEDDRPHALEREIELRVRVGQGRAADEHREDHRIAEERQRLDGGRLRAPQIGPQAEPDERDSEEDAEREESQELDLERQRNRPGDDGIVKDVTATLEHDGHGRPRGRIRREDLEVGGLRRPPAADLKERVSHHRVRGPGKVAQIHLAEDACAVLGKRDETPHVAHPDDRGELRVLARQESARVYEHDRGDRDHEDTHQPCAQGPPRR
jgi:hypothetical protein